MVSNPNETAITCKITIGTCDCGCYLPNQYARPTVTTAAQNHNHTGMRVRPARLGSFSDWRRLHGHVVEYGSSDDQESLRVRERKDKSISALLGHIGAASEQSLELTLEVKDSAVPILEEILSTKYIGGNMSRKSGSLLYSAKTIVACTMCTIASSTKAFVSAKLFSDRDVV
jgi:hypothetical protein